MGFISSIYNSLMQEYSPNPTTAQKYGRNILGALNVAAAAAPLFALLTKTSQSTWLELGLDAVAHGLTAWTIWTRTPIGPLVIANTVRAVTLASGISTFPDYAQLPDLGFHAVNILSTSILGLVAQNRARHVAA
jgi:hypothetical protein